MKDLPDRFKDIKTADDVRDYFRHLQNVEEVIYHPDDSFTGYINMETKAATYTPEQEAERQAAMDRCHEVCRKIDADNGIEAPPRGNSDLIYDIAIKVGEEDETLTPEANDRS